MTVSCQKRNSHGKRAVKPITPKERPAASNVVDLMEALRRSVGKDGAPAKPAKKPRKAASGQKEMLICRSLWLDRFDYGGRGCGFKG
jgi:hypothetical protein